MKSLADIADANIVSVDAANIAAITPRIFFLNCIFMFLLRLIYYKPAIDGLYAIYHINRLVPSVHENNSVIEYIHI